MKSKRENAVKQSKIIKSKGQYEYDNYIIYLFYNIN